MKLYRAQEILKSEEKIDVELNGVSVWIDSVDLEKETAKVHVELQPADSRVVPVDQLQEVQ
ncbi:H-type small acid-soluble spore protein [Paenibacillus sp. OAS669]|uniref:H-type small acid-soluble spore protein n=1 Tax=Paenibacillus sp. OAS669 TaxID=2663821 RepID=UPI00178BC5E0|nr:H-type small acid-soluble spore protein [Paenibacillus sp. OAS669]MBE1447380.1 small acid-soluble spore protein H (minor) [Paenibacillus sp. OAS669]